MHRPVSGIMSEGHRSYENVHGRIRLSSPRQNAASSDQANVLEVVTVYTESLLERVL